jgi:hypothetical protein
MSMSEFSEWLYAVPVSGYFRDAGWIVPTVQSIHIVAIAVLIGSSLLLDLQLAGIVARTEQPAAVYQRYMPWVWSGLVVLLLTGAVMTVAEPDRVLTNWPRAQCSVPSEDDPDRAGRAQHGVLQCDHQPHPAVVG